LRCRYRKRRALRMSIKPKTTIKRSQFTLGPNFC
jgi:hypothetical protein